MSAATEAEVPPEFAQALRELGLARAGAVTGTPLTGGVSSDIWRIDTPEGPVCAKRALARLRVAAEWRAPIERNLYEARWMRVANPGLSELITEAIGDGWVKDLTRLRELENFADDGGFQDRWRAVKLACKRRLAESIWDEEWIEIHSDSFIDVQVKRMHEYKRQLLNLLRVIADYLEIIADPDASRVPRTVIFGGKAATAYHAAKAVIQLIHDVARTVNDDPRVGDRLKLVFVPNYGVSAAERIIPAAEVTNADAIHPGYGFLAENPLFAERCEKEGIVFIGPTADAIRLLGNKVESRVKMADAGVPLIPGMKTSASDIKVYEKAASEAGYPVMIKAAAGGGGMPRPGLRPLARRGPLAQQGADGARPGREVDHVGGARRDDLRHAVQFLRVADSWRHRALRDRLLAEGYARFPQDPLYPYLTGCVAMQDGPYRVDPVGTRKHFDLALKLNETAARPLSDEWVKQAKQSMSMLDEAAEMQRSRFCGGPLDEDDEYDDYEDEDEYYEDDEDDEDGPASGPMNFADLKGMLPPALMGALKRVAEDMDVSMEEVMRQIMTGELGLEDVLGGLGPPAPQGPFGGPGGRKQRASRQ